MAKFLKEVFLFLINKDEKEYYRQRVMHNDHKTYKVILIGIMAVQIFMLLISILSPTNSMSDDTRQVYRLLYLFLFIVCFISYFLIEPFFKKNKAMSYYVIVSLTMLSIMFWGCGISILDSFNHTNLLYIAIAFISASLFICLEPWVTAACISLSSVLFTITFAILSSQKIIQPKIGAGFIISLTTIALICIVGSIYNFIRRINSIKLEFEISKLNNVLHGQARVDDLTKVFNRLYLTEHIDSPLNYGEESSGLLMVDIDHFKKINDNYGHQIGDKCLEVMGNELNNLIKDKNAYCVRYGGEEFLIKFDKISENDLLNIAENFRKKIAKNKISIPGGNSFSYTISIGISKATEEISYNELINKADKALYEAKKNRNMIFYIK